MNKTAAISLAILLPILCASCGDRPAAGAPPAEDGETAYTIIDYYDADGGVSALGLALGEENSEKVLAVKAGDVLIVGDRKYGVIAASLTLPFYTQPSLDEALAWWAEYCESRIERGEIRPA